jgi:FkbM family methyltransferase
MGYIYSLRKKINKLFRPIKFAKLYTRKSYLRLGIGFFDALCFYLDFKNRKSKSVYHTTLFGNNVKVFNHYFWYYHSIDEIFVEEVYKTKFQSDKPVIIDCGANIGLSIIYFKRHYPDAEIIAFEPDKKLFQLLTYNVASFGFDQVKLSNKGLWNNDTTIYFSAEGELGGSISDENENDNRSNLEKIDVVSLIPFLNRKIDFLKIDIEGAEYIVLKDIQHHLSMVAQMFVEFHGEGDKPQILHELLQIIHNAGFRYHVKYAWENQKYPFIERKTKGRDLQLNIFCYRV